MSWMDRSKGKCPYEFYLPRGKVGVYGGILPITKDDVWLVSVIGHKAAYAVARHGAEHVFDRMPVQPGGRLLEQATLVFKSQPRSAATGLRYREHARHGASALARTGT